MKTELKNLKKEMLHAQEEIKRIQSVPLVIGQFLEAVDQNTGIVGSTTGKFRSSSGIGPVRRVSLHCKQLTIHLHSFPRFQLLRSNLIDHRPRAPEDGCQCRLAQAFECAGRRPAT